MFKSKRAQHFLTPNPLTHTHTHKHIHAHTKAHIHTQRHTHTHTHMNTHLLNREQSVLLGGFQCLLCTGCPLQVSACNTRCNLPPVLLQWDLHFFPFQVGLCPRGSFLPIDRHYRRAEFDGLYVMCVYMCMYVCV